MRILYLCDKYYWEAKTARVRFHAIDALFRHPEVQGIKDGPGFPDWVDVPTSAIRHKPDVIFWYMPLKMEGHDKVNDIPKISSFNEMYKREAVDNEILKTNTNIAICHYANTMNDFPHLQDKCLFVNIPHCVDTSIFKDYGLPKTYDIMFTGAWGKTHYPLRHYLHNILTRNRFFGRKVLIRQHPGKRIDNVNEQVVEYARELNQAKIVFTCSMVYKNAINKYAEIPSCNALMVGDYPDERHEFFSEFLVEVRRDMPWQKIVSVVNYWLDHEKEREERARHGMELTRRLYSQEHYAARVVETLHTYGIK